MTRPRSLVLVVFPQETAGRGFAGTVRTRVGREGFR